MSSAVDTSGFTQIPPGLTVSIAAFIILMISMFVGKRARKDGEGSHQSVFWDVFNLITAATIPIALSAEPLFATLSVSVQNKFVSTFASTAGWTLVLGAVIIALGVWYTRKETALPLILFVICIAVAMVISPWIGQFLAGWLNIVVKTLWNLLFGLFTTLLEIEVNF